MLSGCFWGSSQAEKCAEPQLYEQSRSVALVSIPPDLDVPDNRDKLVIPELPQGSELGALSSGAEKPCLKLPPNYFDKPVLEDSAQEDFGEA